EGAKDAEGSQPGGPIKPSLDGLELDPNLAHLYDRADIRETPQGMKWVVELDEFKTVGKNYNGSGLDKQNEPKALGDYVTSLLASPPEEGCSPWKLVAFLPNGTGMGAAVFQRKTWRVLPDPKVLETETKV